MNQENRQCQNCKNNFVIELEDFEFYKKIDVPPPTFCPDCRLQRRLAFLNLVNLYKRPCDSCGKDSIAAYPPEAPYKVYCPPCWWSDKWDPFEYGRDYDFSRPFFEQFDELLHDVPHLGLLLESNVFATSPYTNYAGSLKNCYLIFHADFDENCEVGHYLFRSNFLFDSSLAMQCERCYDSMHIYRVNRGIGLLNQVTDSLDSYFLRDCDNCQNCFASANLRNKKYHIFNKPYTKEEYFKEISKWDLGSYTTYEKIKKMAQEHCDSLPHKALNYEMSTNCTGNLFFESRNCQNCFEIANSENSKYLQMMIKARDSYDVTAWSDTEQGYESFSIGAGASNVKFSFLAALPASNMEYSVLVIEGNSLFGCASIKKGEYVIFNKRYSRDDFHKLRDKIIEQMNSQPYVDKRGRVYKYGEFFPIEISPWVYNSTLADRIFPITEMTAASEGYKWAVKTPSMYEITKKANDLPDHIKDATEEVLKEIIECLSCKKGFKITPTEFSFLRQMNLPLPRRCPFCRIQEKLDMWFKEFRLVFRKCDKCGKGINISKLLEDKKQVFCRECYIKEVV